MRDFLLETDVPAPSAITGKPFRADFERVIVEQRARGRSERYVLTGSVYRASDGRTRKDVEMRGPGGERARLTVIQDTPRGVVHVLQHEARVVLSLRVTEAMELNSGFAVAADDEELGERLIEGLPCRGYRGVRGHGRVVTLWASHELEEALVEEHAVGGQAEDSLRLFNVRLGEQSDSLFDIPADYEKQPLLFK